MDALFPWASDVMKAITEVKFPRYTLVSPGGVSWGLGEGSGPQKYPSEVLFSAEVVVNLGMRFIFDVSKCFIFVILRKLRQVKEEGSPEK